jgi:hypothetical protein
VLLSGVSVFLWLQKLTGSADGLLAAQRSPTTPLQRLATHQKEVAELVSTWGWLAWRVLTCSCHLSALHIRIAVHHTLWLWPF